VDPSGKERAAATITIKPSAVRQWHCKRIIVYIDNGYGYTIHGLKTNEANSYYAVITLAYANNNIFS